MRGINQEIPIVNSATEHGIFACDAYNAIAVFDDPRKRDAFLQPGTEYQSLVKKMKCRQRKGQGYSRKQDERPTPHRSPYGDGTSVQEECRSGNQGKGGQLQRDRAQTEELHPDKSDTEASENGSRDIRSVDHAHFATSLFVRHN